MYSDIGMLLPPFHQMFLLPPDPMALPKHGSLSGQLYEPAAQTTELLPLMWPSPSRRLLSLIPIARRALVGPTSMTGPVMPSGCRLMPAFPASAGRLARGAAPGLSEQTDFRVEIAFARRTAAGLGDSVAIESWDRRAARCTYGSRSSGRSKKRDEYVFNKRHVYLLLH
jgi:hypothetical protein